MFRDMELKDCLTRDINSSFCSVPYENYRELVNNGTIEIKDEEFVRDSEGNIAYQISDIRCPDCSFGVNTGI